MVTTTSPDHPNFFLAVLTDPARLLFIMSLQELIELGATQIIIPGNFPIGCSPSYLSLFSVFGASDFDDWGCLKSYNAFAQHHNEQLQAAIEDLRKANMDVTIVYADYYGAFMHLLDHASLLGPSHSYVENETYQLNPVIATQVQLRFMA